jgi:hypothetical protein
VNSSRVPDFRLVVPGSFPDRDFTPELSGLFWFTQVPDPHVPHAVFGPQDLQEEVLFRQNEWLV